MAADVTHPEFQMAREMVLHMCRLAGITEDELKSPDAHPAHGPDQPSKGRDGVAV